ncbi:MAG TPA: urease accessory protein UreD [Acetobacteraceae bacterium]|jgi:urease accessory protein|nr:urease accessory protein UreD [Acetobacteraceae bacterium]
MGVRDGRTVLGGLRQEGCLKARFPRPVDWPEVVSLNTSGGIAGGDVLASEIVVAAGARATFAAQASERFYRVLPGDLPSRVRTSLAIGEAAAAEWLPQETILFDRCAVDRRLDVMLDAGAWFLGVEMLVFGRAAMGESVAQGHVADTIRLFREGSLLLHDTIRMSGPIAKMLARPAIANRGRAVATVVHVAADAESRIDAVRAALDGFEAGASAWNGMLLARIVAPDGARLRAAVVAGLAVLRDGRALPRVWMC